MKAVTSYASLGRPEPSRERFCSRQITGSSGPGRGSDKLAPPPANTRTTSVRLRIPDELALVQDRHALDPFRLHQAHEMLESLGQDKSAR